MSFMYKSMVSRAPGKRKIKLQEENILQLMQEDDVDEEEDQDFQVQEAEKKAASDSNRDSDTSDSEQSSSSSEEDSLEEKDVGSSTAASSSKADPMAHLIQRHRKRKHFPFVQPTVQSTENRIKSKYPNLTSSAAEALIKAQKQLGISKALVLKKLDLSKVKICSICLRKKDTDTVVTCNLCGISVHRDCYGGNLERKKHSRLRWFCDACVASSTPECEFCPSTFGCIKEASNGQWSHVVCARYILGKAMYENCTDTRFINLSHLNHKLYGIRECTLCEDRLLCKTGICVKCDAGLCKAYFHVTCAQENGLLSENETDLNNETDPYFVYCPLHLGKEKMVMSQQTFTTASSACDLFKKKNETLPKRQKENQMEILLKHRKRYIEQQHTRFPLVPVPGVPPPRQLSSNATAVRLLNRKAEKMFGIDVRGPGVYFPQPSQIRKRHRVVPALTAEFASHYADRELRISEMRERIEKVAGDNSALLKTQSELTQQYESWREKLSAADEKTEMARRATDKLSFLFSRLKKWADENKHGKSNSTSGYEFKPMQPAVHKPKPIRLKSPSRKRPSKDKMTVSPPVERKKPALSSLFKECSICNSDREQHLLVHCDVCKRWLHLGCCDPPLTQMPKKTKFSLWQCSECVSTSEDESAESEDPNHGSLITPEGRRHTQRSHRPPEKLSTLLFHDQQLFEQRKMINHITRSFRKSHNAQRTKYRSRLKWMQQKMGPERDQKPELGIAVKGKRIKKRKNEEVKVSLQKPAESILKRLTDNNINEARVVVQRDSKLDALDVKMPPTTIAKHKLTETKPKTTAAEAVSERTPISSGIEIMAALGRSMASKVATTKPSKPAASTINKKKLAKMISAKIVKPVVLPKRNILKLPSASVSLQPIHKNTLSSNVSISSSNSVAAQLRKIVKSIKVEPWNAPDGKRNTNSTKANKKATTPVSTSNTITSLTPMTSEQLRKIVKSIQVETPAAAPIPASSASSNTTPVSPESVSAENPSDAKKKSANKISFTIDEVDPNNAESIRICDTCKMNDSPKEMAYCGTCSKHCHIWCCDPPLPGVPKSNRFAKWECAKCSQLSRDVIEKNGAGGLETTADGRRKITRTRKPPEKFATLFYSSAQQRMLKSFLSKRGKVLKKKRLIDRIPKRRPKKAQNNLSVDTSKKLPLTDLITTSGGLKSSESDQLVGAVQTLSYGCARFVEKSTETNTSQASSENTFSEKSKTTSKESLIQGNNDQKEMTQPHTATTSADTGSKPLQYKVLLGNFQSQSTSHTVPVIPSADMPVLNQPHIDAIAFKPAVSELVVLPTLQAATCDNSSNIGNGLQPGPSEVIIPVPADESKAATSSDFHSQQH